MKSYLIGLWLIAGCYGGTAATRDVNQAWRGRSQQEIEAAWGKPHDTTAMAATPNGAAGGSTSPGVETVTTAQLHWQHQHQDLTQLPGAAAAVSIRNGQVDVMAAAQPGVIITSTTDVLVDVAAIGGQARITRVIGPSLRWGAPAGINLRWGTVFGMAVGMGRLAETPTPLPSGSLYIGGMLGPRHALIGTMNLASGTADAGGAMGFAWGMGMQWWPSARLAVRGAPALVLAFEPGFNNLALAPGLLGGVGYAAVRAGNFVLDVRFDLTVSTSTAMGSLGVGVNLN